MCTNTDGPRDPDTEGSKRKKNIICYYLFVESRKENDTNELIYKTETDSRTWKTNLWLPRGEGRGDKLGARDSQMHTTLHKIDKQGPTV